MKSNGKNILIAGGGTGGHLFPAIAVGQWLKEQPSVNNVFYMGSKFGIEAQYYKKMQLPHALLPIRGLQRGFHLDGIFKNSLLPGRLAMSWFSTKKTFNRFLPDVVLGTGGYASAIPLKMAISKKIPIVLQEQNSYPGLTTRMFADKANKVCLGFVKANDFLKIPGELTGNPIRKNIHLGNRENGAITFGLKADVQTVFLFGGSQGSLFLNKVMAEIVTSLCKDGSTQVLWQTGPKLFDQFKTFETESVRIVPFIEKMEDAYALSDLVIARAGAITLSELAQCDLPSILLPLPSSAGNHQYYNAKHFQDAGASILKNEKDMDNSFLSKEIIDLLNDPGRIENMKQSVAALKFSSAAEKIGKIILEVAEA